MLIFLDFDGVLRRETSKKYRFDADCLARFQRVLRAVPESLVVVTSSWREAFSLNEIRRLFAKDIARRVIGATPTSRKLDGHVRYREVRAFLRGRGMTEQRWVAVDDQREHYPPHLDNVLIVDPEIGFSESDARRLVRMCGGDSATGSDLGGATERTAFQSPTVVASRLVSRRK